LDALRQWRKAAAARMRVESDVVLPRDLMFSLAERHPRSYLELADVLRDTPWRLEHFGQELGRLLRVPVEEMQAHRI
jgi:hypothetical protein